MKKYLLILVPIFLFAPQLALADGCSVWFDTNPIVAGQGTYLRWSVSWTENIYTEMMAVSLIINNVGRKPGPSGGWGNYYTFGWPTSGYDWVSPGQTTDYSGTLYKTEAYSGQNWTYSCPAVLYVNPADPCPSAIESYWGGGTFLLWSGATRRINTAGYNFCVSNSSGYNYFVSGRSGGEIGSFYNKIPYLPGLTRF